MLPLYVHMRSTVCGTIPQVWIASVGLGRDRDNQRPTDQVLVSHVYILPMTMTFVIVVLLKTFMDHGNK